MTRKQAEELVVGIKDLISSGKLGLPTEEQRKSLTAVAITAE